MEKDSRLVASTEETKEPRRGVARRIPHRAGALSTFRMSPEHANPVMITMNSPAIVFMLRQTSQVK